MGIKTYKALRLFHKVLPKQVRWKVFKTNAITGEKNVKAFGWDDRDMIEYWLEGFNDEGLDVAFKHIVTIYDKILCKDPQWHYFYEDHYSLIRCSFKFRLEVEKYFDVNSITYKPLKTWTEGCYPTIAYQHIYKELFHNFSVLIIEMYKNEDGKHLFFASDRVIHPFFNHALYLAKMDGQLDGYDDVNEWEVNKMSSLASGRAMYAGRIAGEKRVINYYAKAREESKTENDENP